MGGKGPPMQQKVQLLLELGKPRIHLLMCLLTLSGSALSPNFLSPNFPPTRLGATLLFRWMAITFPTAFSPQMWSLAHALGAALVVGLAGATLGPCTPAGPTDLRPSFSWG
jgi:hypothetical protein